MCHWKDHMQWPTWRHHTGFHGPREDDTKWRPQVLSTYWFDNQQWLEDMWHWCRIVLPLPDLSTWEAQKLNLQSFCPQQHSTFWQTQFTLSADYVGSGPSCPRLRDLLICLDLNTYGDHSGKRFHCMEQLNHDHIWPSAIQIPQARPCHGLLNTAMTDSASRPRWTSETTIQATKFRRYACFS